MKLKYILILVLGFAVSIGGIAYFKSTLKKTIYNTTNITAQNLQSGCTLTTAKNGWQNKTFSDQSGIVTVTFTVTPFGDVRNSVIALSDANISDKSNFAASVIFTDSGLIKATNGSDYVDSLGVPYLNNVSYTFRFALDTSKQSYSAYVTSSGSTEKSLGSDLALNKKVSKLNLLSIRIDPSKTGYLTMCKFNASSDSVVITSPTPTPNISEGLPAGCVAVSDTSGFLNTPMAIQEGIFNIEFDATPSINFGNMFVGLSKDSRIDFNGLAAIVRFNIKGYIDARDGDVYIPSKITYKANTPDHFRLVADIPNGKYSAYVTPKGANEITLGTNLEFRSDQKNVRELNNWAAAIGIGTAGNLLICNFKIY
ncbi:MAG TPA: hypothetical protein VLI92_04810 [Candidatus Saccharimonadales bacterium]|nr:hypothetical protein [Candidatus Saccharimonadales bacterium]